MAYKIEFEMQAEIEFSKLDKSAKIQIQKYLNKISERDDPRTLGKSLQDNLSKYWKYRTEKMYINRRKI